MKHTYEKKIDSQLTKGGRGKGDESVRESKPRTEHFVQNLWKKFNQVYNRNKCFHSNNYQ